MKKRDRINIPKAVESIVLSVISAKKFSDLIQHVTVMHISTTNPSSLAVYDLLSIPASATASGRKIVTLDFNYSINTNVLSRLMINTDAVAVVSSTPTLVVLRSTKNSSVSSNKLSWKMRIVMHRSRCCW